MRLLTIAACLILAGCAAPATYEEVTQVDYGPEPAGYQEAIKAYMVERLKDPESAKYQFTKPPVKAWTNFQGRAYGWSTCVYVNAKNSYGGYTGNQLHYFMISDNQVIRSISGDGTGRLSDMMVADMCGKI